MTTGTYTVDTAADAATFNLSSYTSLYVMQFDTASKFCPTLYKQVGSMPAHAGRLQDSVGTWFEQTPDENNRINAWSRGAIGDGSVGALANDSARVIEAASIARALGAWLFIPAGSYLMKSSISNSADLRPHLIEGDGQNQTILLFGFSSSSGLISSGSSRSSGKTLTSAIARRGLQWTVSSTTGWAVGDYLNVRDTSQPIIDLATGTQCSVTGQYIQIKSIDSATQITSFEEAEFAYAATTTDLYKCNFIVGQHFRNFQIQGTADSKSSGATGFAMNTGKDTVWENLTFRNMWGNSITLQLMYNGRGVNVVAYDNLIEELGTPYVWRLGFACWNFLIDGGCQDVGRHYVTTTSASGGNEIESAYCQIVNCNGSGSYIAFIDTHPGDNRYFTIKNCKVHSPSRSVAVGTFQGYGVQTRGRWTTISDNEVVGGDVGILAFRGYGHRIANNRTYGSANGILVQDCYDVTVEGNELLDANGSYGIQYTNTGSGYLPANLKIRVKNNFVTGNPTTVISGTPSPGAFVFDGWDDSCIWSLDNRAPDASLQIVGSAAAAVKSAAYGISTITSTATLSKRSQTVLANATSSAITVNLPAAADAAGLVYAVKKIDSSANTVTIDPNGSETIDGAITKVISTQWADLAIKSNGTAWFAI